jgi:hypothetical protein
LFNGSNHHFQRLHLRHPNASFQDLDIDQLLEPLTSMGTSKAGRWRGAVGLVGGLEHELFMGYDPLMVGFPYIYIVDDHYI